MKEGFKDIELGLIPEQIVKFSGIGCSSKSPTYFLNRSFGFNGLHGRMPSVAQGDLFADTCPGHCRSLHRYAEDLCRTG